MDRRAFAVGLFGWIVPGILAFLFMGTHESAGGEAALGILFAWWALGVAWVAAIAVEMAVTASVAVLHLGGLSVLMPIPFVTHHA